MSWLLRRLLPMEPFGLDEYPQRVVEIARVFNVPVRLVATRPRLPVHHGAQTTALGADGYWYRDGKRVVAP